MRAVAILLALVDLGIAVGGPFYLLVVMAHVDLDGIAAAAVWLALVAVWALAPWAAFVVAWRQARGGAGADRVVLVLLAPIALAIVGQGLVERLPLRGM